MNKTANESEHNQLPANKNYLAFLRDKEEGEKYADYVERTGSKKDAWVESED